MKNERILFNDIKNDFKNIKFWMKVIEVIEAYGDLECAKEFEKTHCIFTLNDRFQFNIKEYFKFQKSKKKLKGVTFDTFKKIWYMISILKGVANYFSGSNIIGAIGGSPIFGSENKSFNIVVIQKNKKLNLKKINISRKCSPIDDNDEYFHNLYDIKEFILKKKII